MASMRLVFAVLLTLPAFCQPRLLLNPNDLDRIKKLALTKPWAANVVAENQQLASEECRDEIALTPRFSFVRTGGNQ
jgi:hypothetical protein